MKTEKKYHVIDDSQGSKQGEKVFESDIRDEASDFYNEYESKGNNVALIQFNQKSQR
jgi:hypothetical protein